MIGLRFGKSFGAETVARDIVDETKRDALRAIIGTGDKLVARAKQKLSVRGEGPSRPGEPPAMHEGMLVDAIGRTDGFANEGAVGIAWGFGVGRQALAKMQEHAARRGETLGDMFAIGNINEYGTVNYELARSHPQRPFIRNTEEELKHEVIRDVEEALGV